MELFSRSSQRVRSSCHVVRSIAESPQLFILGYSDSPLTSSAVLTGVACSPTGSVQNDVTLQLPGPPSTCHHSDCSTTTHQTAMWATSFDKFRAKKALLKLKMPAWCWSIGQATELRNGSVFLRRIFRTHTKLDV